MIKCSYAEHVSRSVTPVDLEDVLSDIKNGKHKENINRIRRTSLNDTSTRSALKKKLPILTGGIYEAHAEDDKDRLTNRNGDYFKSTRIVILDIDHISEYYSMPETGDPAEIAWMKSDFDPESESWLFRNVYAAFRSPGGDGLKVVLVLDRAITDLNTYKRVWRFLADEWKSDQGSEVDPSTCDATRTCFLSYDPEMYHAPDNIIDLDVITPMISSLEFTDAEMDESGRRISVQLKHPEQKAIFLHLADDVYVEHYKDFRNLCSAVSNLGKDLMTEFYDKLLAKNSDNLSRDSAKQLRTNRESYIRSFSTEHKRVPLQFVFDFAGLEGITLEKFAVKKKSGSKLAPMFDIDGIKQNIINWMNKRYAVFKAGRSILILPQIKSKSYYSISAQDPTSSAEMNMIQLAGRNDFRAFMDNMKLYYYNDRGELVSVKYFDIWWNSRKRRNCSGMICYPSKITNNNIVNNWTGFNVDPEKVKVILSQEHSEDTNICQPILDFIWEVICSKNKADFNLVLNWIAEMIQNPTPTNKSGIALVLRSTAQGTGKGTMAAIIQDMIGPVHSAELHRAEDLTGSFNSVIENKLFLALDEVFFAGDKKGAADLKHLITASGFTVNRKFVEGYQADCSARFLFMSNAEHTVHIELDNRRYVVLDVSPHKKDDYDYFEGLRLCMKNGGKESLFNFFQNWKIDHSVFQIRKRGINKATIAQVQQSFESFDLWIMHILSEGCFTDGFKETAKLNYESENVLSINDMYIDYLLFSELTRVRFKHNLAAFQFRISEFFGPQVPVTDGRNLTNKIKFAFKSLNEIGETHSAHRPLGWIERKDPDYGDKV